MRQLEKMKPISLHKQNEGVKTKNTYEVGRDKIE